MTIVFRPDPKPAKRPPKERTPPARLSEKRKARLAAEPKRSAPIKSAGRPRPKRKRTAAEERAKFAREYGSQERHDWVETQPCAACGVEGYSENAHVTKDDQHGTGRKAGHRTIAPLCGPHPHRLPSGIGFRVYDGCHRLLHQRGPSFLRRLTGVDLAAAAAETERRWLAVAAGEAA